jgi:hypothetical protein
VRAALIALLLVAGAAQAQMRATVVESDPPGEAITLARGEVLWLRIAYEADQPVRIWARPYFNGREAPAHSNPSPQYSGRGEALGWFSFPEAAQADEIRIQFGVQGSRMPLEVLSYRVRITATGQPGAPRAAPAWAEELRREAEALSRAQREAREREPASPGDAVLTYAVMLVIAIVVLGLPLSLGWVAWKAVRGELVGQRSEYAAYAAAALTGLGVCLAISLATGRKEAWDSSLYFSLGIPVMALVVFAISYAFPRSAWRWTIAMALGQSVAMLMSGNSLSLWPLSIIAMTICSLPQFAAGFAASWLALRRVA